MMSELIEQLTVAIFVEALLHTLWVGALCAMGLFFALKQLQVRRVHLRYGAALLAFSVISLSLPVVVAVLSAPKRVSAVESSASSAVIGTSSAQVDRERSIASELKEWEALVAEASEEGAQGSWEVFVFAFWIMGSFCGLFRLVHSFRGAVRLRRGGEPVADLGMADLCERFGLRRVVPVLSTKLSEVPAVCGLFKPVILFPLSQLTALAPAQLEAILAHELAHIRRCDHLVNFVQLVAEAFLFFNPFLWWVSGQVRHEREAACDALAVEVTGERLRYVQTLADVAAGQLRPGAAAAVSFAGHSSGSLLDRVKRLLRPTASPELRLRLPMVCALLVASLGALVVTQWVAHVTVKALTPEERIERVEAVHDEYPQYAIRPNTWNQVEGEKPRLSGQLLLPDGTPLDKSVQFYSAVRSWRGRHISSHRAGDDGGFELDLYPGEVSLLIPVKGFAPLHVALGIVKEAKTNMVYSLEPGFSAQLRFVDPTGKPVSGVEMEFIWDLAPSGRTYKARADAAGIVELVDLGDLPMDISCRAAGYQEASWDKVELKPLETRNLVLQPSQPLILQIEDAISGEAIVGANVEILNRDFPAGAHMRPMGSQEPSVTSVDGRVVVDNLNDLGRYYFGVSAAGYSGEVAGPFSAGGETRITLRPQVVVPVRIAGIPEALVSANDQVEVKASYNFTYGDHRYIGQKRETFRVEVVEGVAQFDFGPQWLTELEFKLGDVELNFSPVEILSSEMLAVSLLPEGVGNDIGFDLKPVEIHLKTPDGEPTAEGRLQVHYIKGGKIDRGKLKSSRKVVGVIDGVAKLDVPVPNELTFTAEGIRGYWFQRLDIEVPAEALKTPLVAEIETMRAGAIAGSIDEPDGSAASGVLIGVFETKRSIEASGRNSLHISVKGATDNHDQANEFLASPLPLGGSYIISAYRAFTYVLSEPIKLTGESPVHQIRLEIPEGKILKGRVVNEQGEPIYLAETKFLFEPKDGHRFSRSGPRTDRGGRFQLEGINPEVDGAYYLLVESESGYQPMKHRLQLSQKEQIVSLKTGRSLRGVVLEADTGKVIPGAEVYAMRAEYEEGAFPTWFDTAHTDAQGRFEFTNLPEGAFKIASRSGKMASGYEAVGHSGRDDLVEVEIELYEWSKLVPVDGE